MITLVAIGCAALAAVAYGIASVLQAVGARRAAAADEHRGFVFRLLHQLPYLAGLTLDGIGFAASVVALRRLPLFVVQSLVASSVGVTALVAARFLATRLARREVVALCTLGAGLVLLAASAQPESAKPLPTWGRWLVLLGVAGVAAATLAGLSARGASGVLAAVAGLAFTGVAISARAFTTPHPWWHVVFHPLGWAIVGYGILGALVFAVALERGSVTITAAITFAVETVLPAALGVVLLGDHPRPGFVVVAAVGFAVTVASSVALARHAEAAPAGAAPA